MPIPVQDTLIEHVGNGVTTVFSYPFTILSSDDLKCRVDGALVTTGFTVSGVGSRTGGSVTFSSAPASLASVLLYRQVSLDRETDYQENGDLLASVIDDDFDRAWMAIQDLSALNERSLRVPVGEVLNELPAEADRDGYLAFAGGVPVLIEAPSASDASALALNLASTSDASKGAGMVGFIQSGAGAVARTVQSKARETVSVKDFGAVGDGDTDDTAAIQSALTAVGNAGGGKVLIPKGSYIFSALTVPAKVRLVGDGLDATYLKTSTTGTAITLTTSVSHGCSVEQLTLQQTGSVQGKGIAGTDVYWFSTEFVRVTGFVDNLYFSKAIYHTHKRLLSENSTNGVNYYGAAGAWNTDWFNNVLTFDTCRFSSCTVTGVSIKGCEVVFINPDFSGMTNANAIGLKVYGDASGSRAHGVSIITPYVESTDIGFSFSYANVTLDGGFIQGGPSSGASAYTSIIDADESIIRWNGKPRDQDYFDCGWRLTNNSELACQSTLSGSVKASNTVDATSFAGFTFQGTFTATLTGCTTAPTVTGRYCVNNGQVTITIPANTATSNTTACTVTGLPQSVWPARDQFSSGSYIDNGIEVLGALRVSSSGAVVLSKGAYGTAFTNIGTKGHREISLSYMLS